MSKFGNLPEDEECIETSPSELEEIITSLSKDKNATYRELTEEEKAINREVWGEDNITRI